MEPLIDPMAELQWLVTALCYIGAINGLVLWAIFIYIKSLQAPLHTIAKALHIIAITMIKDKDTNND